MGRYLVFKGRWVRDLSVACEKTPQAPEMSLVMKFDLKVALGDDVLHRKKNNGLT